MSQAPHFYQLRQPSNAARAQKQLLCIKTQTAPYFERQRGDACRVHALNALFGRPVIDEARLREWAGAFDAHYGHHVTDQFDCVQSDSLTLVSFILEQRCGYVTHYLPIVSPRVCYLHLVDPAVPAIMMFNAAHIWTLRRWSEGDGQWYNLDSLLGRPVRLSSSPPSPLPPQTGAILICTPAHGRRVLLPFYRAGVCRYVREHNLNSDTAVRAWGAQVQQARELGALETWLCNFLRVYCAVMCANAKLKEDTLALLRAPAPSDAVWSMVLPLLQFVVTNGTPS